MAPIFGYVDFPIFALFSKTFDKPTPPTILVKSSSKSLEMIFRPSLTKRIHIILILTTVCPVQPLNFSRKAAKQEVKSYLSKLGKHVEDTTTCSHVQRQLHIFKND